jgi:DNA-binding response OmpR family regulator
MIPTPNLVSSNDSSVRLLIVEDNQEIRDFLKNSLGAQFAVDCADNGKDGLYLAQTNNYDLIVLDNMLPEKTGLEICEELRKEGKTTPIIILSVKSEAMTKVELLNAGADDYISKPFSLDELLARIRALLRRPQKIEDDVITIGDLTIDTRRQSVKRGDEEIYLTRKEFMLLEYLARNKGTVLSRGMIMEHVWDVNADLFSNTIESHILSLRKKIHDHDQATRKLIHTIPGRGYKVDIV